MNAPIIDLEPVSLEEEIVAVRNAKVLEERDHRRKWLASARFRAEVLTAHAMRGLGKADRSLPVFLSLAFVGILAVAWIYEQRLAVL